MYLPHFGLKREPFNLTPDPDFLYLSENHQEALARIQLGVQMRKGFIVITGEVGAGKSTLIRTFFKHLPPNIVPALIVNTKITAKNLIQNICKDFGIKADYNSLSKDATLNLLYEYILESSFKGRNLVVVIDEAHDLGVSPLEEVRLLTNLETNTRKLLQVVLVGQPELWDLLGSPELRALKQRIQLHYHLNPLDLNETKHYILHRLQKAGYTGRSLFTSEAIEKIFIFSRGIPRIINILCSNALLLAYTKNKTKIDLKIIEKVWEDFSPGHSVNSKLPDKNPQQQRNSDSPPVNGQFGIPLTIKKWQFWTVIAVGFLILQIIANIITKILGF